MGVVRYLCITILLACLVAAQDCNSNGWFNSHNDCVCHSGFDGVACANNFAFDPVNGCNINAAAALNKKDDRFPVLDDLIDTITFKQNILKLAIAGEIVPNRKYDNITFIQYGATPIAEKCKLVGASNAASFWSQKAQTTLGKCRDSFVLSMPWNQWSACGFSLSASESVKYWVYRATMLITYTDALGRPFDIAESTYRPELVRHSSVSYKIYVLFRKSIEIEVNQLINVNNTVNLNVAVTKFEYEPSDQTLTLGLSTIVLWPNMLIRNTMNLAIQSHPTSTFSFDGQGAQTGVPTTIAASQAEDDIYCPLDKYNNCLQYFEFSIKLDSGCDFNGIYIVSATVATCRDHPNTCTNAQTQSFVTITKSDVCGQVTAEPLITGKLLSFDDQHNPVTEYELGYKGYFEVDMVSSNDFNLTFIDIWVVADMDVPANTDINSVTIPSIQWLYRDGQVQLNNFHRWNGGVFPDGTFQTSPVDLVVHPVTRNANAETIFTPKFEFLFDSRIFHIPLFGPGIKKAYTLHARGRIVYAGNEKYAKRAEEVVDFVWKTDAAGLDSSVRFGLAQTAAPASAVSNFNAAFTSLAPVAGIALAVIGVAVVAAVVIIKRKTPSSYATLN